MATTIIDLTQAFCSGGGGSGGGDKGRGGGAAGKRALEEYVKTASFVLLRLKMKHSSSRGDTSGSTPGFKFFCMYAFLDKFIEQCSQVGACRPRNVSHVWTGPWWALSTATRNKLHELSLEILKALSWISPCRRELAAACHNHEELCISHRTPCRQVKVCARVALWCSSLACITS